LGLGLLIENSLSDVASVPAARANLGLTDAATMTLPVSIENGGTGATTGPAAIANLGGLTAATNNTFTGTNTFTQPVQAPSIQVETNGAGTFNIQGSGSAGDLNMGPGVFGTDPRIYIGGSTATVPNTTVIDSNTTLIRSTAGSTTFANISSTNFNVSVPFTGSLGGYQTWTPGTITGSGTMTISAVTVNAAKYIRIGPMVNFYVTITCTVGSTSGSVTGTDINIPAPIPYAGVDFTPLYANGTPFGLAQQSLMTFISSGGLLLRLSGGGNWPVGSTNFRISGCYEVA
jgi:hypothetical protein